ncbi:MAG TPA: hypothetical protein VHE81_18080, partial [Lacipirellulaceae bacterium]|nr:hypothetical protein [Lacipirellulaceae bacterium]
MFDARQTARCLSTFVALLFSAGYVGHAAAQSAAIPNDQWRAAGSSQYEGSSAQSTSDADSDQNRNQNWQLPNGQSSSNPAQPTSETSNPLRHTDRAKQAPAAREPLPFNAPTNAGPLKA